MKVAVLLGALALAAALPHQAQAAPADEVKALLDQNKAAEAYALGKRNPDQLGNPEFDFYYGVAAVDAGHAGEGVLALERYVANFPDNQAARLELARAYFVLGDNARAREEFDNVQKSNPPPNVQANIQRFMDAIRARESAYQTTGGFYAEMGVGHDSNVNAGVSNPNVNLPIFGAVTLQSGVKIRDDFATLGIGGNVSYPVAPGIALFASGNIDTKMDRHQTSFDQDNINAVGGMSFLRDKNLYRVSGIYNELAVGHDWYRQFMGVAGEVNHQLDEFQMLGASIQIGDLRYAGANEPRNADLWAVAGTYRKAFIGSWQPLLTISPTYGEEHNTRSRPDLGRRFYGGRVALAVTPMPKWSLAVGGTYQKSNYDAGDPLLGVSRSDQFYSVDAALNYAIDRNWSVRGEYQHYKNTSSIPLFEFTRDVYALKLRYEFK
jgi:tetratricopeptide (TPR) repeat protein